MDPDPTRVKEQLRISKNIFCLSKIVHNYCLALNNISTYELGILLSIVRNETGGLFDGGRVEEKERE